MSQHQWQKPVQASVPKLMLYNSLTKQKEEFVTMKPGHIKWYNCGPTVYDASHMGHARTYLTFDIVRRVLEDYFNYRIEYVMNITDIDDKIILRARQNYLFEQYLLKPDKGDLQSYVRQLWTKYAQENIFEAQVLKSVTLEHLHSDFETVKSAVQSNRAELQSTIGEKFPMYWFNIEQVHEALQNNSANLMHVARDLVSADLDKRHGAEVTDLNIFTKLTTYWEGEYFKDMQALDVRPPDVLTRVTEYVPEIIAFVQKIIENGYGYEVDGSVYFDSQKFQQKHAYGKLNQSAAAPNNQNLLNDGEGSLGAKLEGKRTPADFALWKCSKPGEPHWPSPWGAGRPGWHIECSAMAAETLGAQMDIHSGGVDLCFPHHENELAQSEAYFGCHQWVNYFLHAGHLHIQGQKMSKSLKNFVTIQEALQSYTGTQMRLMFLLHHWNTVLDYKESSMKEAMAVETTLNNFFDIVQALKLQDSLKRVNIEEKVSSQDVHNNYKKQEMNLMDVLHQKQDAIHASLCDSINTPNAMLELMDLVSKTNIYLNEKKNHDVNLPLLDSVAKYVTRMLKVFGVVQSGYDTIGFGKSSKSDASLDHDKLLPYVAALSSYRDRNRQIAQAGLSGDAKQALKLILSKSDEMRDSILPQLGVQLEDQMDGQALIKLKDLKLLMAEIEQKQRDLNEKKQQHAQKAAQKLQERLDRLEKGRLHPKEMFRSSQDYSQWDDLTGLPTHDSEGVALSKSRVKNLAKEQLRQEKLHKEFHEALKSGEIRK